VTVHLEPMPPENLPAWIDATHREYAESRVLAGESREAAEQRADASRRENFPDDRPLDSHLVFDVWSDDTVVGHLWLGVFPAGGTQWWVFDIEIHEPHRRHGYARAALELGQQAAKDRGATAVGLNVFGFNTGAKELYDSLGYRVTATQMKLEL